MSEAPEAPKRVRQYVTEWGVFYPPLMQFI